MSAKRKVFVSLPIGDKSPSDVKNRHEAVSNMIMMMFDNVEIIDSYIEEPCPSGTNPGLWYLGKSLEKLAEADLAFFDVGWEGARGCLIEHDAATCYGIECVHASDQTCEQ